MAEYRLPEIPYLRLRATLAARDPVRLPGFLGSTLRGAFGHALRRLVCAMGPEQPCVSCTLRGPCVYTRLFETFLEAPPPPFLKGLTTAPRPYVIEPAAGVGDGPREFRPGDSLSFDLLLFGQAAELYGYAALALGRMAEQGLGTRRARFTLVSGRPMSSATASVPLRPHLSSPPSSSAVAWLERWSRSASR